MQPLELSKDHAAVLETYLLRALSDLSVEIAATDGHDYREKIKAERLLLQEILAQLVHVQQS